MAICDWAPNSQPRAVGARSGGTEPPLLELHAPRTSYRGGGHAAGLPQWRWAPVGFLIPKRVLGDLSVDMT